jgi:cyclase
MHHERVSENVYWFQSDIYAQVTAGVVAGPQWAIVIDTLALPEETLAIRDFVEHEVGIQVRYVINTHYHADHTWGNCFFPGATIISHSLCRDLLAERAIPALENARKQNPAFRQVKIVLPHLTFDQGVLTLRVGKKNLTIMPAPGHSADGIAVLIEEDRVLFAGDAFMPLPMSWMATPTKWPPPSRKSGGWAWRTSSRDTATSSCAGRSKRLSGII